MAAIAAASLAHSAYAAEQDSVAHGPIFVSFDGMPQLAQEASRQRLLSQKLGFTVTVDTNGNATDCTLTRKFRRKATEIAICRPLLKYLRFDPARNARGEPVEGRYSSVIDFNLWMTQRGYLEPEYR